jgi:hypothetical protein
LIAEASPAGFDGAYSIAIRSRLVEIRHDLPDFRRRMLTGQRRSGLSQPASMSAASQQHAAASGAVQVMRVMERNDPNRSFDGVSAAEELSKRPLLTD